DFDYNQADWGLLALCTVLSITVQFFNNLGNYLSWVVGARWRKALTETIQTVYLRPENFYRVCRVSGLDTPESRISNDLKQFVAMICGSNEPTVNGILFTTTGVINQLCIMVPFLYKSLRNFSLALSLAPYVYMLCIFLLLTRVSRGLIRPTYNQEKLEGNYRFHHTVVRENCESIAFYGGDKQEEERADAMLTEVVENTHRVIDASTIPMIVQQFQASFGAFLVDYIIGLGFFLDSTCIPAETLAFQAVVVETICVSVTSIASTIPGLNVVFGVMERITDLCSILGIRSGLKGQGEPSVVVPEARDSDAGDESPHYQECGAGVVDVYQQTAPEKDTAMHRDSLPLFMDRVSINTPDGAPLLRNVSFTVRDGESLAIVGNSGCGKSSILRVLAGLWQAADGRVNLPSDSFFVPQAPYLSQASLQAQVMYPMPAPECVTEDDVQRIMGALEDVDLTYLSNRFALDAIPPAPWSEMLSVGEKQRLGFARLLFHSPAYAILDESTSALPVDLEEKIMRAAFGRGIACVSVAHRPSCIRLHDRVLSVANGTASPISMDQYNSANPRAVIPPHTTVASHTYPVPDESRDTVEGERETGQDKKAVKAEGLGFLMRHMTGGVFSRYSLYFGICVAIYCIAPSLNVIVISLSAKLNMDAQCPVDPVTGLADTGFQVSVPSIWRELLLILAFIVIMAPFTAISSLLSFRIGISWRERVTRVVQGLYFKDSNYYRL
ncbi:hypothetical protein KIPB_008927, partial [Kipferlia bialata]